MSEHGKLARIEAQPLAGVNIEALLAKAVDAKAAVEVLERLQAMRKEIRAEQAEAAFHAAMGAFQAECPVITKRKMGAKNAYRYAPLDHIIVETKALIQKHGFSFGITAKVEAGWVEAICTVKHEQGHHETSEFKAPVDVRNPMMSDPQKYGAAITFAKRYAFCNGFGILTADEDTDAPGKAPRREEPLNDVQMLASELWAVLKPVRGTKHDWDEANNWLWREEILDAAAEEHAPKLSVEKLRQTIAKSKERLAR